MNTIQYFTPSFSLSHYLETIATKKAMSVANTPSIALTPLEKLAHSAFLNIFYFFYPEYIQIYHEKQVEVFTAYGQEPPAYVNSSLKEGILFLHRFIASPSNIGSAFPSSSKLIDAMTRKVSEGLTPDTPPRRYLDIGAGTGSFTEGIIAKMRPQDTVEIVEYDERLAKLLQMRFGHLPNVKIHNVSIFSFNPDRTYDVVVTGLPLNNFSAKQVELALQKYAELTKSGGSFSYFEYMLLPSLIQTMRRALSQQESFENIRKIQIAKNETQRKYTTEVDSVYWNMTPARAIHCKV